MSLQTGQILQGRYYIASHLGQGGMGTVYQAQDMRLNNRRVAVKEFDPVQLPLADQHIAMQSFQREAAILAGLSHPGLTAVHDYFLENDKSYLVMEYVQGETLQQVWERVGGRIAEAQTVAWVQELCDVLSYLHSQQPPIIFRDLKPGNIMVQPNGRLKLIDFGIARHFIAGKTSDTVKFGTPGYAAPEQYGQGQTDARSDVYALGVVAHQLLTGHDPTHTPFHLPPIADLASQVSPLVAGAINQALAMDPALRPAGADVFQQMLVQRVNHPPERSGKRLLWVALGGLSLLFLGGFYFWGEIFPSSGESRRSTPASGEAIVEASREPTPGATPSVTPTSIDTPSATPTKIPTKTPPPTETPTATATTAGDGRRGMAFFIPAGEFTMGTMATVALGQCQELLITETCQLSWFQDEEPIHTVYLDAYYMDPYEVTNEAFARFLNAQSDPRAAGDNWLDVTTANGNGPLWYDNGRWQVSPSWRDHPVIYVSWYGARAYCSWQDGRLPTEAEWEKASRGVNDTRIYPWGNSYSPNRANICDNRCPKTWANSRLDDGYATTAPVGSYPAGVSPYGLYDMSGNVFEWTTDWYAPDYYAQSPAINPPGPTTGERYVVRGGSWQRNGRSVRLSYRYIFRAAFGYDDVGFRCVYEP